MKRASRHSVGMLGVSLIAFCCLTSPAMAAVIVVGEHTLQANQSDQEISILVQGGGMVSGIDLFVQVGDGGPELGTLGLPPGRRGPRITDVELIQGTVFQDINDLPSDLGRPDIAQTAVRTLALLGAIQSVNAQGTLARLTLDTTGLYHGEWDLWLSNVLPFAELNGPFTTNFAGVAASIQNGRLTIAVDLGDFNQNAAIDVGDVDLLAAAIRNGNQNLLYDVTGDEQVDQADWEFWVHSIARTFFGDANLDSQFDTSDLVEVFQAGQYEDQRAANSTWLTGDWDGDAEFGSSDIVLAFQDGGYEQGPRPAVAAVPEPTSYALQTAGALFGLLIGRRCRQLRRS